MYGVFITLRIGVPSKKALDNRNELLAVMCMIQHSNFLRIMMNHDGIVDIFLRSCINVCRALHNPSVATGDFWG